MKILGKKEFFDALEKFAIDYYTHIDELESREIGGILDHTTFFPIFKPVSSVGYHGPKYPMLSELFDKVQPFTLYTMNHFTTIYDLSLEHFLLQFHYNGSYGNIKKVDGVLKPDMLKPILVPEVFITGINLYQDSLYYVMP